MIIERIKLHNIRSYEDAEIKFTEGITLLSGDIGAGKTTILLALEFALLGTRSDLSTNALLRKGKRTGSVEVELKVGGKKIIVKRKLKTTAGRIIQEPGILIIDNVKRELSPVELKTQILSLLGYPESLQRKKKSLIYRFTVYTPQGEMKKILFEKSDERLDTLRKLFGVDKYKRIKDNSNVILTYLRLKAKELEVKSEGIEKLKEDLKEIKEEINKLNEEKERINSELGIINKEEESINKKLINLKEEEKELNRLKEESSAIQSKINEKKENVERIKKDIRTKSDEIKKLSANIKETNNKPEIEESINKIEGEYLTLQKKISAIKTKKEEIERRKEEIKKEITRLKETTNKLNETISQIKNEEEKIKKNEQDIKKLNALKKIREKNRDETASVKSRIEQIKQNIKSLEGASKCPLCMQPLSDEHRTKVKKDYEKQLEELNNKLNNLQNQNKIIDERIKNIEKLKEENNKANIKLAELRKQKIYIENSRKEEEQKRLKLAELNKESESIDDSRLLKELNKKKEKLNSLKEELNRIIEQEKIRIQINHLTESINNDKLRLNEEEDNIKGLEEKLNKKLELIKSKEPLIKEITKLEEELKSIQTRLKNTYAKSAEIKKEIQIKTKMKEDMIKDIKEKGESEKKLKKTLELRSWINTQFLPSVDLIEKQAMATIHSQFNSLFQEWFNRIIDDESVNARLSEDFSPIVTQNGYDIEIENLSGGEKTALALAYRLALNKVINDLTSKIKTKDLIILDEPTDGFSEKQLDKVRDIIRDLNMKQIIIVSHEAKVETFVDKIIRIVKNNHVSQIIDE